MVLWVSPEIPVLLHRHSNKTNACHKAEIMPATSDKGIGPPDAKEILEMANRIHRYLSELKTIAPRGRGID